MSGPCIFVAFLLWGAVITMGYNLKLKISPEAKSDLFRIFQYISTNLSAPVAAKNLIDKIEKSCRQLSSFPFSGVIFEPFAKQEHRMIIVENFIIVYRVEVDRVLIMRVEYGKRGKIDI